MARRELKCYNRAQTQRLQVPQSKKAPQTLSFQGFALDLRSGELFGDDGKTVRLPEQQFQILVMLLERPGQVISREEIRKRLWPSDTIVEFEHSINAAMNRLRQALNDTAENPSYIETLSRRGYRFIAPLSGNGASHAANGSTAAKLATEPVQTGTHARPWLSTAGIALASIVLIAALTTLALRYSAWFGKPSLDFHERDWVLISNFENRTGEPRLDGTLEYAVERELSNSQFVNVVPPERIADALRLMRKPLDTKIDASIGREICLRDGGIRALLTGRVEKVGSTYVLSANLVDPVRGVTVASLSEEDPVNSEMAGAIRRLSDHVRERLGEEHRLVQQNDVQLEKVTTPSLHALQLYTQADQAMRLEDASSHAAIDLLERALQEDPNFASAHLLLGYAYFNTGHKTESKPEFERAFELADSVSDRERFFILGSYYQMVNDPERAIAAFEALLRLYPDHYWCLPNLQGLYVGSNRWQDAVDAGIRRFEISPRDLGVAEYAIWGKAISEQDWEAAKPYINRANELLALQGENPNPYSYTWLKLLPMYEDWVHGDIEQAHAKLILVERTSKPNDLDYFMLGMFHLYLGELEQAHKYFQGLPDPRQSAWAESFLRLLRGENPPLPRSKIVIPSDGLEPSSTRSIFVIRAGMTADVEKAIRKARPQRFPITEGELALAQGNTAKAILLFEQGLKDDSVAWPLEPFYIGTESLARIYEKQGKLADARRVLLQASAAKARTYPDPYFQNNGLISMWMQTQLHLADVDRKMGRVTEAEKIEDELSKLLIFADPDHPILRALQERQYPPKLHAGQ